VRAIAGGLRWCEIQGSIPASTATASCARNHEPMFGSRLVHAFGEVKALFDQHGL
jgi:hypothetical protein